MSHPQRNQQDEWRDCQPGELHSLAIQLRRETDRRKMLRAAVPITLAACLPIGVGLYSASIPSEPNYGGIVCSEVKKLADDFVKGLVSEADAARIAVHIQQCQYCRDHIDQLRAEQELTGNIGSSRNATVS